MKKIFTTLLIVLTVTLCKAQWVTIPDANFVAFLQANYPGCMVGSQMNTNCTAIVNAPTLICPNQNISDLTGIQYFTSLAVLDCNSNLLTSLPPLPNSLTEIDCQVNQLVSLPVLPTSLTFFNCSSNQLTSLPTLPNSLTTMFCYNNLLTSIPVLPNSLTGLDCGFNYLSTLPSLNALTGLRCDYNFLTSLPVLPNGLNALRCEYNQLTSLPALPASLNFLFCSINQLTNLPTLPSQLYQLSCNNNQLSNLPELPNTLNLLQCSSNELTSLPVLPLSLNQFWVNKNYNLICLPVLQNFTGNSSSDFNISNTGITCLPNAIQHTGYIATIDTMPICSCTFPSSITTSNITTTSAKVNWSTECCSQFQIQKRVTGTTTWSTVTAVATATSKNLTALTPGTTYDLRMRVKCTDGTTYSSWSPIQTFTTLVTCVAPTGVTVTNLTQTHATINWAAVTGAYSYKFSGRKLGTTAWTTYTIYAPLTVKQLNGLTANTTYQFRMQTVCNASGVPTSPWTAISTFATPLRMEDGIMDNATIDFTIYPNPVSQLLTFTTDFSIGDEIEIKDLLGRTLITQTSIEEVSNTIDVSSLSNAQYFVSIRKNDGSVMVEQFVKE